MTDIVLGNGFAIDANVATKRTVLLGQPESGKTNGATVIAEGLLKLGVPVTVLDWKGDLWGMRILDVLFAAWPKPVDRDTLADRAGASPTSSSFANNLAAMNSIGVIERVSGGLKAHDDMFPTGKAR